MSLEFLFASGIGVLAAGGFWLLLRARTFDVILGLTLLSYAVNLFLFAAGRLAPGRTPLLKDGVAPLLANHTDPLPQALVLTAIVISMAMTAVMLVMAMQARVANATDHIDGREPRA
ncbi:Na+/H+ antiporter subunit C [Silanimonas sp.]|jgi:multicomponent K+:H+ antiporter subunit C|uniref:Na+/H+ antiporter subunit C n=1 Tax=Silanimonas sp. TaxID=1929290 RepID=UPI0037C5FF1C